MMLLAAPIRRVLPHRVGWDQLCSLTQPGPLVSLLLGNIAASDAVSAISLTFPPRSVLFLDTVSLSSPQFMISCHQLLSAEMTPAHHHACLLSNLSFLLLQERALFLLIAYSSLPALPPSPMLIISNTFLSTFSSFLLWGIKSRALCMLGFASELFIFLYHTESVGNIQKLLTACGLNPTMCL